MLTNLNKSTFKGYNSYPFFVANFVPFKIVAQIKFPYIAQNPCLFDIVVLYYCQCKGKN